ncbi:hypothetical protein GPALN_011211 [Globodera pallida]|nr:hypothetical protein GPALN_011211 [Globodera pallida]
MAAAALPKVEKKIMDEKIAKVREVVKNVSANDIVLALHNFELDVGRTIHAFCEGGAEVALGDWERTGAGKKRTQKKKTKGVVSSLHSQPKETSGTTTPSVASLNCSNVSPVNFADKLTNGGTNAVDQATTAALKLNKLDLRNDEIGRSEKSLAAQQHQFVHLGEFAAKIGRQSMVINSSTPMDIGNRQTGDVDDSFGLADYQSQLAQNREMFEREVTSAEEAIYQCFKELRELLSFREQRLLDELTQCRKDGLIYFNSRNNILRTLIADCVNPNNKSFMTNLEKFNDKKTEDLEVALTARFLHDNSPLTTSIGQLGKVPSVKSDETVTLTNGEKNGGEPSSKVSVSEPLPPRTENVVKRSNSPSSLVSSVGEDSGLGGQISPVNHVEKKSAVQVEENGIVLKSDSVSADQLAEIQRQIAESLKAKGIDPSVLANFGSTTVARRRPPNQQTARNGASTVEKTGKVGPGGQRKQQQQMNGGEKRK